MKTDFFRSLAVAATLIFLQMVSSCPAQDETKDQPKPTTYTLWAGNCNRSFKIVGTFDNAATACHAAEAFRKSHRFVGLVTGDDVRRGYVLSMVTETTQPKSCSVARKSRRCGNWFVDQQPTNFKTAKAMVEELRKTGQAAEVIYHM